MKDQEIEKVELSKLIKLNRGLNILSNSNLAFKDIEVSYELSLFRAEVSKLQTAMEDAIKASDKEGEDLQNEAEKLLKKKYEIEIPVIKLSDLKDIKGEVPLMAFDFLNEFITK